MTERIEEETDQTRSRESKWTPLDVGHGMVPMSGARTLLAGNLMAIWGSNT